MRPGRNGWYVASTVATMARRPVRAPAHEASVTAGPYHLSNLKWPNDRRSVVPEDRAMMIASPTAASAAATVITRRRRSGRRCRTDAVRERNEAEVHRVEHQLDAHEHR